MLKNVSALIVTFNPDPARFKRLIASLVNQVGEIIIIDNGSGSNEFLECIPENCLHFISLKKNYGIAYAQNMGINHVLQNREAGFVLLLDHDSILSEGMVNRLLEVSVQLRDSGRNVAAVGPRYVDQRQENPPPFIRVEGFRVKRLACEVDSHVVPVSYLIASGSLISVETFRSVGGMKDELFVDYVDIEWGLRAGLQGFGSYGVCDALMDHDLGDDPISIFNKKIPLHSPLRHYYLFRNAIYLYTQSYLPFAWKVGDLYRLMLKYGFYTLFAKPRWQHFSMMSKGMWDGLRGKMGKRSGA